MSIVTGQAASAPLLEARNISKYFGAITALNDVNFHVDPGEVLRVVGDNGAGMALGAVEALKAAVKLKDVVVVGYDANPDAAKSILAGEMTASVAQAPKKVAALGIQTLVDMKAGKQVPMATDPGTVLVTKENAAQYK